MTVKINVGIVHLNLAASQIYNYFYCVEPFNPLTLYSSRLYVPPSLDVFGTTETRETESYMQQSTTSNVLDLYSLNSVHEDFSSELATTGKDMIGSRIMCRHVW